MTAKLVISLDDLGSLATPATSEDIAEVEFLVGTALRHTGGNAAAALALLIASISALAERCEEHVGVLAAAWMELDEELRGHGAELAAVMPRLHPRIVEAITDGEVVAPKPDWQEDVIAAIDAVPPALDHFDRGDTQDLPEDL